MYKDAMLNATVAPDHKHAMIRWQEERLKTKTWELKESTQHLEIDDEKRSEEKVVDDIGEDCVIDSEFEIENDDDNDDDDDGDDVVDDVDKMKLSYITTVNN